MKNKTCGTCKDRETCTKPCEWLREELKKVTTYKQHITFSELNRFNINNKVYSGRLTVEGGLSE